MSDTLEPKSKQIPNLFPPRQVVRGDSTLGPGYGQLRFVDSAQAAVDQVPGWFSLDQLTSGVSEEQLRALYKQIYDINKIRDRHTAR